MKKIILVLITFMCLLFNCNVYAEPEGFSVSIAENVKGYVGEDIQDCQITLTIEGDDAVFDEDAIKTGDNIKDWFTNIPDGLTATVERMNRNKNVLYVTISGKTSSLINECIQVTIPANMIINTTGNPYISTYVVETNDYAKYIIEERQVSLVYKQDYTVSGKVNEEITPQDVVVVVSGDLLVDDIVGTTLLNDFGLIPTISAYNQEINEVTITYTGTPNRTSQEEIDTTFLASYFKNYKENAHVPNRVDVKFDIIEDETPDEKPHHPHIIKPILIPIVIPKIVHTKQEPVVEKQETTSKQDEIPEKKIEKVKYTQPNTGIN